MTRILVLGATGMLGHVLLQSLAKQFEVAGCIHEENTYPELEGYKLYSQCDALNANSYIPALDDFKPDVVINAIGIIKQMDEAKVPTPTIAVNALLPHQLQALAAERGARFIQFSTDCVFKGDKGQPYLQSDEPDARDLYGVTKWLGEINAPNAVTLRTAFIGRELRGNKSLLEWVLSQPPGSEIQGFSNALYTGFTTHEMARIVAHVIQNHPTLEGVWQVASKSINKYDLLHKFNDYFNCGLIIHRNETFHCDRRMDGELFNQRTGYHPPSWDEMLAEITDKQALAS